MAKPIVVNTKATVPATKARAIPAAVKKAIASGIKQDFDSALVSIQSTTDASIVAFNVLCAHIVNAPDYSTQQSLIARATDAYLKATNTMKRALGSPEIQKESAQKQLERRCKLLWADYKIASDKPEAKKKQARKAATGGKALKTGVKAADKKPSKPVALVKDGKVSVENVAAQIRSFTHALEMVIPSKNIEPLRAATIAYLTTIQNLCK